METSFARIMEIRIIIGEKEFQADKHIFDKNTRFTLFWCLSCYLFLFLTYFYWEIIITISQFIQEDHFAEFEQVEKLKF